MWSANVRTGPAGAGPGIVSRGSIPARRAALARKLLLGKVPRSDPGIACYAALRAAGAWFGTADEAAAFTVLNAELAAGWWLQLRSEGGTVTLRTRAFCILTPPQLATRFR
jgi:hypothetical protein